MRDRITSTFTLFTIVCCVFGEGRCCLSPLPAVHAAAPEAASALPVLSAQDTLRPVALLTVTSDSTGYFLFLDNEPIGSTPLSDRALSPGSHTLKALPHRQPLWGLPPWQRELVAAAAETLRFHVPLLRYYSVSSTPFDAGVYVDGKYIGMTPTYFAYQGGADAYLEVRKQGYREYAGYVTPASPPSLSVRLLSASGVQNSVEKMLHVEHTVRTRRRILSWGFLGAAVLSGAASIQFKQMADESYAAYLNAAVPDELNRHFDDARRYDDYATLAYGGFQLSFILWTYFFFTSR